MELDLMAATATIAQQQQQQQEQHRQHLHQQQQQQQQQLLLPADTLTCQWQGCQSPHHPSAEALYDHVCDSHIGRKSTNNLNLQCFWGSCRTVTVKRDHITSHIRVHVPLKPHKCDVCGKPFKRPQDLKKHVKTHADESVLFPGPDAGRSRDVNDARGGPPNGYQAPTNHDQSYADASAHQHLNYPYGNPANAYGGNGLAGGNFAPLYAYGGAAQSSYATGGGPLTESRKRTHDALNDFFGQAKRRHIDPGQYQDLGAQFSQFLQMFAPSVGDSGSWQGGYNAGYGNSAFDNGAGGMAYQAQHAPPMAMYDTPFPEVRTKSDLMNVDQFLEQLQNTVYDNSEQVAAGYQPAAAAGMQSAAAFGFPRRSSGSPPGFKGPQSAETPRPYSSNSFALSSNLEDTPALTASSFGASQSPQSTNRNLSPNTRNTGASLYPMLPSFNTLDPSSNAFGVGPTSAPSSGLGPQYDEFDARRRYSGGQLQRARQSPPAGEADAKSAMEAKLEGMDTNSGERMDGKMGQSPSTGADGVDVKLPSVSEITRADGEEIEAAKRGSEESEDTKNKPWETNVKVIEALRQYLSQRLQRGEYERGEESEDGNRTPRANQDVDMKGGEDEEGEELALTPKREGASLYPMLRPVEA